VNNMACCSIEAHHGSEDFFFLIYQKHIEIVIVSNFHNLGNGKQRIIISI
jgi:hypothetical protein